MGKTNVCMSTIVKFVVANEENAYKVSELAKKYYSKIGEKDVDKTYNVSVLLNNAASFTREWLMAFEVTGEDEDRQEEPLAFIELVSSNIPVQVDGNHPVFVEKAFFSERGEGLSEVLKRAHEIAAQRKHDVVWAQIPDNDVKVVESFTGAGFSKEMAGGGKSLYRKNV